MPLAVFEERWAIKEPLFCVLGPLLSNMDVDTTVKKTDKYLCFRNVCLLVGREKR